MSNVWNNVLHIGTFIDNSIYLFQWTDVDSVHDLSTEYEYL